MTPSEAIQLIDGVHFIASSGNLCVFRVQAMGVMEVSKHKCEARISLSAEWKHPRPSDLDLSEARKFVTDQFGGIGHIDQEGNVADRTRLQARALHFCAGHKGDPLDN